MSGHSRSAQIEPSRNRRVRKALGDKFRDFEFSGRQRTRNSFTPSRLHPKPPQDALSTLNASPGADLLKQLSRLLRTLRVAEKVATPTTDQRLQPRPWRRSRDPLGFESRVFGRRPAESSCGQRCLKYDVVFAGKRLARRKDGFGLRGLPQAQVRVDMHRYEDRPASNRHVVADGALLGRAGEVVSCVSPPLFLPRQPSLCPQPWS